MSNRTRCRASLCWFHVCSCSGRPRKRSIHLAIEWMAFWVQSKSLSFYCQLGTAFAGLPEQLETWNHRRGPLYRLPINICQYRNLRTCRKKVCLQRSTSAPKGLRGVDSKSFRRLRNEALFFYNMYKDQLLDYDCWARGLSLLRIWGPGVVVWPIGGEKTLSFWGGYYFLLPNGHWSILFCSYFSPGPPKATILHVRYLGLSHNKIYPELIVIYHGFGAGAVWSFKMKKAYIAKWTPGLFWLTLTFTFHPNKGPSGKNSAYYDKAVKDDYVA